MIHPNMATMLAFLSTDANVEAEFLRSCLKEVVEETFNMITIDGDTSTNDSVILLANGQSAGEQIKHDSAHASLFREGLRVVCTYLAKEIIRDAEGASKLMEITVNGARTMEDARKAARTVAGSTLVKTAVHGGDPNWGRVAAALGYSGAEVQEEKLAFYINDVCIMEDGRPIPFHKEAIIAIMSGSEVKFRIDLNIGNNQAIAWGCNLSEAYVTFNSAYTT
jgi:glutamate N-acetyltransferase/amino-acid N-acetyltransferase